MNKCASRTAAQYVDCQKLDSRQNLIIIITKNLCLSLGLKVLL